MKIWLSLLFMVIFFSSCTAHKSALSSVNDTNHKIHDRFLEIIQAVDSKANMGLEVYSLKDKRTVFKKNADRYFLPASTIKIITLAAALHYLGPHFRFDTDIYAEGLTKEGSVKNLYIKGSGDPSLMDHDLYNLAFELKQMGIKSVSGNVYVDASVFDDMPYSPGVSVEDRSRGYGAPVSGINLNYNRLLIKALPSFHPRALAHVIVKPHTQFVKIKNKIYTKNKKSRSLSIDIRNKNGKIEHWPNITSDGIKAGDNIILSGYALKNSNPSYTIMAVSEPDLLAGTYFLEQLRLLGIKVVGRVESRTVPLQAVKIISHQSRSLSEALIDFTKISNNVAADSLLKAISAQNGEYPASAKGGLKLVGDFLANEVGIDPKTIIAVDGSGLSRYNLVTPHQMIQILNYGASKFSMGPEFMAALPIGGIDGTLSSSFKDEVLKGNIRAKTGSLSGVSNLVGYFVDENNERFAFAFMINGFIGSAQKYRTMQEDLILSLFKKPNEALATK